MSTWTKDELAEIAETNDLYVSPFREDSVTYGTPTRVWPVIVCDHVYVRPASGPESRWFVAAVTQKAGRVRVGETEHEVTFEHVGGDVVVAVDAAYEGKYPGSSAVPVMQGVGPRSATVRVSPR